MPIWILVHQKLFILSETMETSQDGKERSFKFRSCIDADHTRTFDLKSQPQPLTSSQCFFFTHEGKCQMFAFSEGAGCYFSWQAWAQQLETCSQVREADKVATPPPELFFFSFFFSFLNGVAKEKMGAYQENLWFCKFTSINYKLRGGSTTVRIWLIHRSTQFSVISAYLYSKHSSCFCFQLH